MIQASDGGYTIAGATTSYGAGGADVWLIKTDQNGNHQWNQTYGGTNNEQAYSVAQTNDGYAIAGATSSFGAGGVDVWLIKTDNSGTHQWNQTYGGSINDYGFSVAQTSDDGYAIAGYTRSFGSGEADVFLVKVGALTPSPTPSPTPTATPSPTPTSTPTPTPTTSPTPTPTTTPTPTPTESPTPTPTPSPTLTPTPTATPDNEPEEQPLALYAIGATTIIAIIAIAWIILRKKQ